MNTRFVKSYLSNRRAIVLQSTLGRRARSSQQTRFASSSVSLFFLSYTARSPIVVLTATLTGPALVGYFSSKRSVSMSGFEPRPARVSGISRQTRCLATCHGYDAGLPSGNTTWCTLTSSLVNVHYTMIYVIASLSLSLWLACCQLWRLSQLS